MPKCLSPSSHESCLGAGNCLGKACLRQGKVFCSNKEEEGRREEGRGARWWEGRSEDLLLSPASCLRFLRWGSFCQNRRNACPLHVLPVFSCAMQKQTESSMFKVCSHAQSQKHSQTVPMFLKLFDIEKGGRSIEVVFLMLFVLRIDSEVLCHMQKVAEAKRDGWEASRVGWGYGQLPCVKRKIYA